MNGVHGYGRVQQFDFVEDRYFAIIECEVNVAGCEFDLISSDEGWTCCLGDIMGKGHMEKGRAVFFRNRVERNRC